MHHQDDDGPEAVYVPHPEEGHVASMIGCEVLTLVGFALFGGALLIVCSIVSGVRDGVDALLMALWG